MWVEVSCPRCSSNRCINGVGTCGVCHARLIYRPAPRVRRIDCRAVTCFQWHADPDGPERVHPDNGSEILEEHGYWLPVMTDWLELPKADRRRTARPKW